MECSLQLSNVHPISVQPHKKLPKNSTALKLTLTTLVLLGICFISPPQLFFHCRVCLELAPLLLNLSKLLSVIYYEKLPLRLGIVHKIWHMAPVSYEYFA